METNKRLGEFELNKIYLGSCLDGIKELPDNSIDLIILDAPYGDDSPYGRNEKEIENNGNPLLNLQVIQDIERIIKNNSTIYNFTNWKHYPFITEFILRYTKYKVRMLIVLKKENFGLGYGFRNQHELIMVIEKGKPSYNLFNLSNVIDFNNMTHTDKTHPHEKPLELMRKLIKHSSLPNDIILDCFCGSGSTLVACKQLNRNFIGFETDKNWFELSKNRLSQTILKDNIYKHQKLNNNNLNNPEDKK